MALRQTGEVARNECAHLFYARWSPLTFILCRCARIAFTLCLICRLDPSELENMACSVNCHLRMRRVGNALGGVWLSLYNTVTAESLSLESSFLVCLYNFGIFG